MAKNVSERRSTKGKVSNLSAYFIAQAQLCKFASSRVVHLCKQNTDIAGEKVNPAMFAGPRFASNNR